MKSNKHDRTIDEGNSPVTGSLGQTTSAGITVSSDEAYSNDDAKADDSIFPKPPSPDPKALKRL